jgi:hypothetical protein
MGMDVNLYVEGDVFEAHLQAANAFALARGVSGLDTGDTPFVRRDYTPVRIEWRTLTRFYGLHYERGHWPAIHNAIRVMQGAFPGMVVHYGSDSFDEAPEVTDDFLAELWDHWLGPDGRAYSQRLG